MRGWSILLALGAACGKSGSSGDSPQSGSGASAGDARGARSDPRSDAGASDADPDNATPFPADIAALIPEGGILIATVDRVLMLHRLDRNGLHTVGIDPPLVTEGFGWLDERTLVVHAKAGNGRSAIATLVDGTVEGQYEPGEKDWPANAIQSTLEVTRGGQAWLRRCTTSPAAAATATASGCANQEWIRVVPPKPTTKVARAPADLDPHRAGWPLTGRDPWPLPPTAKTPEDMVISLTKIQGPSGSKVGVLTGVTCKSLDGTTLVPDTRRLPAGEGFDAKRARWVLTEPPILEVEADLVSPGLTTRSHVFFAGCAPEPLSNFAWLGEGIWATFEAGSTDYEHGTWRIHAAGQELGTIAATDVLRPNPRPPGTIRQHK